MVMDEHPSMTATAGERTVREGSTAKRAAILAAGRDLFLADGFERTSMDALAARAAVSKRTIYDYYGDKQRLLLAVAEDTAESLLRLLQDALTKHLSDDSPIRTRPQLEQALTAFAIDLGTTVVGSAHYTDMLTLIAEQRAQSTDLEDLETHLRRSAVPEDIVAERLAHFHHAGIIDTPDPRLAADQFIALTIGVAYSNQPDPARADPDQVRNTITAGVQTFMRAYATRNSTRS